MGERAFTGTWRDRDSTGEIAPRESYSGMSLRDYFAGQALAGYSAQVEYREAPAAYIAAWAYEQADAMLAHRREGDE